MQTERDSSAQREATTASAWFSITESKILFCGFKMQLVKQGNSYIIGKPVKWQLSKPRSGPGKVFLFPILLRECCGLVMSCHILLKGPCIRQTEDTFLLLKSPKDGFGVRYKKQ